MTRHNVEDDHRHYAIDYQQMNGCISNDTHIRILAHIRISLQVPIESNNPTDNKS